MLRVGEISGVQDSDSSRDVDNVPSSPFRDTVDDIGKHLCDLQGPWQNFRSWSSKYRKIETLELIEHFRDRLQSMLATLKKGKLHKLSPIWLVISSLHDLKLEFDTVEGGELKILVNCLDEAVDRVLQQPCLPDDHGRSYVFPRNSREGVTAARLDTDFLRWLSGILSKKIHVNEDLELKCAQFSNKNRIRKTISVGGPVRVDLDDGSDGFDVQQAIKLIRHCAGDKKSLHDVDDYFVGADQDPLDKGEVESLKLAIRRALVAPEAAEWWNNSILARAILIGISQFGADGNMTGLQYVLRSAVKLQSQLTLGSFSIDDGHLFGWTAMPVRLFGTHIASLKGDSRVLAEFENRMHQVQLRCIPQFLLQVTRLSGIVTSQIDMATSLQTNILAALCGVFLIAGQLAMNLYVKHYVENNIDWS